MLRLYAAFLLCVTLVAEQFPGSIDEASAPAPALGPQHRNLEDEVQRLEARLKQESSARKIDEMAALGAMRNATAERKAREAAQKVQRELESKLRNSDQDRAAALKQAAEEFAKKQKSLEERYDEEKKQIAADREQVPPRVERGSGSLGRVGEWLRHFPEQQILATVAVILGLLSVLGPTALIDFVFAAIGSCVGGLLLGSGSSYWFFYEHIVPEGNSPLNWIDLLVDLIHGDGSQVGYLVCGVWTLLGLARYFSGCKCQLFASVPQVKIGMNGEVETPMGTSTSLKTPLMNEVRRPPTNQNLLGRFPAPNELATPLSTRSYEGRGSESLPPRVAPDSSPRSARSAGRSPLRSLPKPQPSRSTGIISRLQNRIGNLGIGSEGAPGPSHSSGRPGGVANGLV